MEDKYFLLQQEVKAIHDSQVPQNKEFLRVIKINQSEQNFSIKSFPS